MNILIIIFKMIAVMIYMFGPIMLIGYIRSLGNNKKDLLAYKRNKHNGQFLHKVKINNMDGTVEYAYI